MASLPRFAIGSEDRQATPPQVQDLAFCVGSAGEYLVGGCDAEDNEGGLVQLWDVKSGELLAATTAHGTGVACLGVAPQSGRFFLTGMEMPSTEQLASCAQMGGSAGVSAMHLFDVRDIRTPVASFETGQYEHHAVSFSSCETYVQATGKDHRVVVYDRRKASPHQPLHILFHQRMAGSVVEGLGVPCSIWAHRSPLLLTGAEDGLVYAWDMRKATPLVQKLKGHQAPLSTIAIAPDDLMLASGDDSSKVMLYAIDPKYRLDCIYKRQPSSRTGF